MNCPKCGGPTWDNAQKVLAGWRGPLIKCHDKSCGWIQWPPKPKSEPKAVAHAPTNGHAAKWTWASLSTTYHRSLVIAAKHVITLGTSQKMPVTMADVLAGAHTIFICATRDGVQEPKPEPPAATAQNDEGGY